MSTRNRPAAATRGATLQMSALPRIAVGVAGWSLRKEHAAFFDECTSDGATHLCRYASRFPVVEVNSSFYRPHRRSTWRRWAESVPATFRFSVKAPKQITHDLRLAGAVPCLEEFLEQVCGLEAKLGVLLFQLPPTLALELRTAERFLVSLRSRFDGKVAIEPRHPSWFGAEAASMLAQLRIARVAADPAVVAEAARPGGWRGFAYHRLHGSPVVYTSSYDGGRLDALRAQLAETPHGDWTCCIFDNTRLGAATTDALALLARLQHEKSGSDPEFSLRAQAARISNESGNDAVRVTHGA
jgi:uncharacterized protein YecE (DUF72 family)